MAAGLAKRCEIQIAYGIGIAHPVSVIVDTFSTGKYSAGEIAKAVQELFGLRPTAIIKKLDLRKPIYKALASYVIWGGRLGCVMRKDRYNGQAKRAF